MYIHISTGLYIYISISAAAACAPLPVRMPYGPLGACAMWNRVTTHPSISMCISSYGYVPIHIHIDLSIDLYLAIYPYTRYIICIHMYVSSPSEPEWVSGLKVLCSY